MAVTVLAWLVAIFVGPDSAALSLGFIPARLSGLPVPWFALPALLTPLSATLVHSGFIHLAFNMLVFVWCGTAVERVLGRAALLDCTWSAPSPPPSRNGESIPTARCR